MPRYFFDTVDGGRAIRDEFGTDLDGDDEAREEAIGLVLSLARDATPDGDRYEIAVAARNEAGAVAYEATLSLDGRRWPRRR